MAATAAQQAAFIAQIAPMHVKHAKERGYKCVSGAIAQACLESGYGLSKLASMYHNYHGLKCGSSWKGASINMKTMEEYTVGTLTAISDNFRVYQNMDQGVAGYYDFLNYTRYKAVKDQTDPQSYLQAIKAAGYATSSAYVTNNMNVVKCHNLTAWDAVLSGGSIPEEIPAAEQKTPVYKVGNIYELAVELNVRTGPGIDNRKKNHSELTADARKHDVDRDGAIDAGTRVSCLEVIPDGSDIWIRIPSGYVAAYWKGNEYVKAS